MLKDYKISACIVTHNNAHKVGETIESLLEHTKGVELKIFIVDNISTDNTLEIIRSRFPKLTIIETGTNYGYGHGNNAVLPFLDSKYHVVINPDITIKNDTITQMADYLDTHDDIGMLSPKVLFADGREQILGKRNPKIRYLFASRLRLRMFQDLLIHYAMLDEDLSKPIDIEFASGCFMFIRTELFTELKGFDDRFFMYFEDVDITRRVNLRKRTLFFPNSCVFHEWERSGAKKPKMFWIQIKSMIKYFIKWKFTRIK